MLLWDFSPINMLLLFYFDFVRSSSGKCLVDNKQIKRKEVNASPLFLRFDLVTSFIQF